MKTQVMKPFRAPRNTADITQVKSIQVKEDSPHKHKQTGQQPILDSEEPTELGLVWPQPAEKDVGELPSNPWWPDEPSPGKDATEQPRNGKDVIEESPRLSDYESEGFIARRDDRNTSQKFQEGFEVLALARQKETEEKEGIASKGKSKTLLVLSRQKQKGDLALKRAKADLKAKDKILRMAEAQLAKIKLERHKQQMDQDATSDDDEDNVSFSALLQQESNLPSEKVDVNLAVVALGDKSRRKKLSRPRWVYEPVVSTASAYWDTLPVDFAAALQGQEAKSLSDDEDDNLPIVSLIGQEKLDVLATVSSGCASIVYPKGEAAIGVEVARDFGGNHGICFGKIEMVDSTTRRPLYHCVYADGDEEDYDDGELQYAIDLHFAVKVGTRIEGNVNADIGIFNHLFYANHPKSNSYSYMSAIESGSEEEAASVHAASDDSSGSLASVPIKKRAMKRVKKQSKQPKAKKVKLSANSGGKKTFILEGVLLSFPDKTAYGSSFRAMSLEEQCREVIRLNKGAATGMKGAIKKNRINVLYKDLVAEKMRDHYILHRADQQSMFRAVTPPRLIQRLQLKFLSIGE
jgi:hypothetical protein